MKIQTTIRQAVIRNDGTSSVNERTTIHVFGDNPRFERAEAHRALAESVDDYAEINDLNSDKKL